MAINVIDDDVLELNKRFIINRETVEIDVLSSSEALSNINREIVEIDVITPSQSVEYTEKYDAGPLSSKARSSFNLLDSQKTDRDKAENRISAIEDRVGIFLYNLFPYQGLSSVSEINPDIPGVANAAMNSLTALSKLKYFTPAELALTLGHNFYTLHFLRGITIKKGKKGSFTGVSSLPDIWSGGVDLFYGRGAEVSLGGIASKYLGGIIDIPESSNTALGQLKQEISPLTRIGHGVVTTVKKQSFVDQLNASNTLSSETRSDLFDSIMRDQIIGIEGAWSKEEEFIIFKNWQKEYRRHEVDQSAYLINKDVLNISQRVNEDSDGKWRSKTDRSGLITEEFDIKDAELRRHEEDKDAYLINKDVLNISQRVNVVDGTSWKFEADDEVITEQFTYRDALKRIPSPSIDRDINPDVYHINLKIDPSGTSADDNLLQGDPINHLRNKGFVKDAGGRWQLGAIYVIPVTAEQYKNSLPRFYIPFEFNPDISENSIDARYQETQILSRIGNLQSFTGTNSLSVSLTCKYFAVWKDGTSGDSGGQNWMSEFTLEKIQAIEMGFRSLVYPHFPDAQEINQGYKYVKPPLIKVILGNYTDSVAPYANLLTYQGDTVVDGRLNSSVNYGGKILRSFIATSVSIKKDLMETPIYLDEHKSDSGVTSRTIRDTFGFEASLNLIEVTPNYIDAMPDFRNYFNQYNNTMAAYVDKAETKGGTSGTAATGGR